MKNAPHTAALRSLPSVGALIDSPIARGLSQRFGRDFVKAALRSIIDRARREMLAGEPAPAPESVLGLLEREVVQQRRGTLRPVINATGIVLHTNLGRAPLGQAVIAAVAEAASGYCNLEFNLDSGRRGERTVHARELFKLLTGAEDALVVNNNAASLFLALSVLAK